MDIEEISVELRTMRANQIQILERLAGISATTAATSSQIDRHDADIEEIRNDVHAFKLDIEPKVRLLVWIAGVIGAAAISQVALLWVNFASM